MPENYCDGCGTALPEDAGRCCEACRIARRMAFDAYYEHRQVNDFRRDFEDAIRSAY